MAHAPFQQNPRKMKPHCGGRLLVIVRLEILRKGSLRVAYARRVNRLTDETSCCMGCQGCSAADPKISEAQTFNRFATDIGLRSEARNSKITAAA
jgi:hypothetical protein